MQAISYSVCCIKVSGESVVRSLVLIFKNKESAAEEIMVVINGPNLSHADVVIKEAMNSDWNSRQAHGTSFEQLFWSSRGPASSPVAFYFSTF